MPPRALVTDAEDRSALAACRSLAEAGYEVSAAAGATPAPGHWSRCADERIRVAHPRADPEGFVSGIEALVREGEYDVLLPGSDASLLLISRHRERIEPYVRTGLPSGGVVERCFDKWGLVESASRAGLAPPQTLLCADRDEALAAARQLGYPVLLKPRHSARLAGDVVERRGSRPVANEAELVEQLPLFGLPCLVQRRVAGPVLSSAAVAGPGGLIGFGVSRYLRVFPPDGGNVAFSQTIEPPAGLEEKIERLVADLGWEGIFELELLDADGRLGAIDFNPRPYGSMSLAVAAGAPLPALWCELLLTGKAGPVRFRTGLRYRCEDADLRHMLWQLRRGRVREARAVLRPHRHVVHAYFRLSDPWPLLARFGLLVRHRLARHRNGAVE